MEPKTREPKTPRQQVEAIKDKAELQATMHATLSDENSRRFHGYTIGAMIVNLVLLAFVLASPNLVERTIGLRPDWYLFLLAALTVLNVSLTVVVLVTRPDGKAAHHRLAVRHQVDILYGARALLDQTDPISLGDVEAFRLKYLDDRNLPGVPERDFPRLKSAHHQKIELSKIQTAYKGISLRRARVILKRRLESQILEGESRDAKD